MRHLEKLVIFTLMVMVLIYTVNVDRIAPSPKQEIPASISPPATQNNASFFPESEPNSEDESIIEETFTEVP